MTIEEALVVLKGKGCTKVELTFDLQQNFSSQNGIGTSPSLPLNPIALEEDLSEEDPLYDSISSVPMRRQEAER